MIAYESRSTKNTWLLSSATKLFYYFFITWLLRLFYYLTSYFSYENFLLVKRFLDIRREKETICPKTCVKPAARPRRASESQPSSSEAKLNSLTFLKSQPTLPVRDVTHIPGHTPIWDFYCDIPEWNVCSARTRKHLRSCLYLTNLCTEPKGSQPN